MIKMQKRVAVINDISCLGRCSLTVALPIISAADIETAVIPTALLSTHTGGFEKPFFQNLGDGILKIAEHWHSEKIHFDAIYTGYLGSAEQIESVIKAISLLKSDDTVIITDPVMADNGKLYKNFSPDYPQNIKRLCAVSDIIMPNITETCLLLGEDRFDLPHTEDYIGGLLSGLKKLGVKTPVITGVCPDSTHIGAACLNGNSVKYALTERIDAVCHGTGDIFASASVGAYLRGQPLERALKTAAVYTRECIISTDTACERRMGVAFETALPKYFELLGR